MRAIKIMLSSVEAKNTRVHFCLLVISKSPQVYVDNTRWSSTARQGGRQDTERGDNARILSEQLRYSFPSKQQGQTTDASHSLADEGWGVI